MKESFPSQSELELAFDRVRPNVHATPVLTSSNLNTIAKAQLFFKCENFQKMGAFKMRGATNAILKLTEAERAKGVVTHSSGNFAQAVSLAAKNLGVSAHIVMPSSAPQVKVNAVEGYGGKITISEATIEAREAAAGEIVNSLGATFLHPSNDMDVILGNATVGMELLEKHSDLDCIITPVGGGGLLAGTALAAHYFGNECDVFGAEPSNVDDAYRSFHSGIIETNNASNTIADGLRTNLGDQNFPIIKSLVRDILLAEEEEIVEAMKLVWERLKIVIEPSSAVAMASILKNSNYFEGKKVGIIFSGGNVDLTKLPF